MRAKIEAGTAGPLTWNHTTRNGTSMLVTKSGSACVTGTDERATSEGSMRFCVRSVRCRVISGTATAGS